MDSTMGRTLPDDKLTARLKASIKRHPAVFGFAKFLARTLESLHVFANSVKVRSRFSASDWNKITSQSISTFPEYMPVESGYALRKILDTLRVDYTAFTPWRQVQHVFNYQDNTYSHVDVEKHVVEAFAYTKGTTPNLINHRCTDISKKRVGESFRAGFGYDLEVDPLTYKGLVVVKSDENAAHDGKIISSPIALHEKEASKSYTRLVNNIIDGYATDMRIVYFKGVLHFFYLKRRPQTVRFGNRNSFVTIEKTADYFTAEELEKVSAFARHFGADYCEMDAIRDVDTKELFIVDVNKTPMGPPNGLPRKEKNYAMREMAYYFAQRYLL